VGVREPRVDRRQAGLCPESHEEEEEGCPQPERVDAARVPVEVGEEQGIQVARAMDSRMMPTKDSAMPMEQMKTYFHNASSDRRPRSR